MRREPSRRWPRRARRARRSFCVPASLRSCPLPSFVPIASLWASLFGRQRFSVRLVKRTDRAFRANGVSQREREGASVRRRVLLGLGTAGATAAFLLLGGILSSPRASDPIKDAIAAARTTAQQQDALARLLAGLSTGDTAGYVRELERRVERDRQDADALTLLGLSYQQRGRETGDPSFYTLS